jgi:uncharacterized membrane protein YhfC
MMTGTVSGLSIATMAISAIIVVAIVIAFAIIFRKKGADISTFFIGAATFFLFALILESMVHQIVLLRLPIGTTIQNNIWLYALYGGAMAGLFEEVGRFTAFKTVLKNKTDKPINAFMYGIGHGGCEAILIFSITMISNIVVAVLINSGTTDLILNTVPDEATRQAVVEQFQSLIDTNSFAFCAGVVERANAIVYHIAASVLVWMAAREGGKTRYLYLAIIFHGILDFTVVIASKAFNLNVWLVEAIMLIIVVALIAIIKSIYKKEMAEA